MVEYVTFKLGSSWQHGRDSRCVYSHVDVRRLEAALVDVVEGEGLRGVGAVLVHLHCGGGRRPPGAAPPSGPPPLGLLTLLLLLLLLPACANKSVL